MVYQLSTFIVHEMIFALYTPSTKTSNFNRAGSLIWPQMQYEVSCRFAKPDHLKLVKFHASWTFGPTFMPQWKTPTGVQTYWPSF